ncbi:PilZ domain-containing protein [Aurantiacibacter sp. MUD61]|uniref:PilZ domain-containing protein n=1 Tax=Aurantiacibacter sp. MUD61 TaxID=3009083 RepID=UPI0022EFF31C|nr:PilZ domain-containing protein [Aurantiacibacter sp. MUD61]
MIDLADTAAEEFAAGEAEERRGKGRASVNLECEIKVGSRAWRKTQIRDLTPGGFQVQILDMPPRGTPIFVRMANLQMMQAEVCWTDVDKAGCKFTAPLSEYVFNHILEFIRS